MDAGKAIPPEPKPKPSRDIPPTSELPSDGKFHLQADGTWACLTGPELPLRRTYACPKRQRG